MAVHLLILVDLEQQLPDDVEDGEHLAMELQALEDERPQEDVEDGEHLAVELQALMKVLVEELS